MERKWKQQAKANQKHHQLLLYTQHTHVSSSREETRKKKQCEMQIDYRIISNFVCHRLEQGQLRAKHIDI